MNALQEARNATIEATKHGTPIAIEWYARSQAYAAIETAEQLKRIADTLSLLSPIDPREPGQI